MFLIVDYVFLDCKVVGMVLYCINSPWAFRFIHYLINVSDYHRKTLHHGRASHSQTASIIQFRAGLVFVPHLKF